LEVIKALFDLHIDAPTMTMQNEEAIDAANYSGCIMHCICDAVPFRIIPPAKKAIIFFLSLKIKHTRTVTIYLPALRIKI